MTNTTAIKRIENLREKQIKISAIQAEAEREMDKVLGLKLSPVQFFQLRELMSRFEDCEQRIIRLSEQMEDLSKAV